MKRPKRMDLPRKRVRRSAATSPASIAKRLRETFIDGLWLIPMATVEQVNHIKSAVEKLAKDWRFWEGLRELARLKQRQKTLAEAMKMMDQIKKRKV
jgi:hypothetical protein